VQYNQPFDQQSNPNAPYNNGNPATGTQGSIVPAAAVEYPQREIVNAVTDIGLATPTNADLHQLSAATRFMRPQYLLDTGGVNTMQIAMSPSPLVWAIPLCFFVLANNTSTISNPVISIVGVGGSIPIVRRDNTALFPGDIRSGSVYLMMFDGTSVRVVSFVPSDLPQVPLNSNLGIYVNGATGSDTLYDGTSPTISGVHGPFATIQKGCNQTSKYNLNGYTISVYVADWASTYAGFDCPSVNGAGTINVQGNIAVPGNVKITRSGASAAHFGGNGQFTISGFQITETGSPTPGDPGACIWMNNSGGNLSVGSINFGSAFGPLMSSLSGSVYVGGPLVILSGITAGSAWHATNAGSKVFAAPSPPSLTIQGPCNISIFAAASVLAELLPQFSSISGASNVTGQKYQANNNAVISTNTNDITYLPGNTAGAVSSGAQYS
jgi:hypothetical protein